MIHITPEAVEHSLLELDQNIFRLELELKKTEEQTMTLFMVEDLEALGAIRAFLRHGQYDKAAEIAGSMGSVCRENLPDMLWTLMGCPQKDGGALECTKLALEEVDAAEHSQDPVQRAICKQAARSYLKFADEKLDAV